MNFEDHKEKDHLNAMQVYMRNQMKSLFGVSDTSGVELVSLNRIVMNLYEVLESQRSGENELSGPRWGLLMRLFAEEERGNLDGITPTSLSRFQNVSKNTISALLRGLEEQGFINRALDPTDYRLFRIQLTDAGREVVKATAPQRIQYLNEMVSEMSAEERDQLILLLSKLYRSLSSKGKTQNIELNQG